MASFVPLISKPLLESVVLDLLSAPDTQANVSSKITALLMPARAAFYAATLARVEDAVREVEDDPECEGTADDYAEAAHAYIPDVQQLRKFPGPGTTALAFDLVLKIAEATLCDMDRVHGAGFGEREGFDEDTDAMLLELAKLRREEEPGWKVGSIVWDLKATSRSLEEYGIEGWFPKTIALMEPWAAEQIEIIVLDDD